jgi:hypothetical protein
MMCPKASSMAGGTTAFHPKARRLSLAMGCHMIDHGALTRSKGGRFLNKFCFGSNSMFREFN